MIRAALTVTELYTLLGRHDEAAKYYIKIAQEISDSSVVNPLFLEQAAYCYLAKNKRRKFSFYMVLAGKNYERLSLKNYSFNCFAKVHAFYSNLKWNNIRFFLYSSLGRNSQNLGDINLAVQFFRNLLQLCTELQDAGEQQKCLNEFLLAVGNWSQKQVDVMGGGNDGKANIG